MIKTFKEDILSTINLFFKIARKGFCEMRLVKSPGIYHEMTKIYHGLMIKFAKSWKRKNEFINRQFINNEKSQSDYDQLQCIGGALIRSWKEWFNLISLAKLSNLFALTTNHWSICFWWKCSGNSMILVNGKLVSNFLWKANIYNDFFSQQCQAISNESIFPSMLTHCINKKLNDISII